METLGSAVANIFELLNICKGGKRESRVPFFGGGGCKASICLAIFIHCAGFLANGTIGSLFHYLQGCIHPRWLAGFLPSTLS